MVNGKPKDEKIYFIDTGSNIGSYNMAVDHYFARLESLDAPIFRTYSWKPHCISLGYHQKLEEIDVFKCEQNEIDIVRRETGGRAVYHAEELTYSIVIPKISNFLYDNSILKVYYRISEVLVLALKKSGINDIILDRGELLDFKKLYKEKLSAICFSSTSTFEVVSALEKKKIVGSAQKRLKNSILQHGSILIGKEHINLIDFLKISDKLKIRFKEIVKKKTISIEEVLNDIDIKKQFVDKLYNNLTNQLIDSLEESLKVDIIHYNLSEKDKSEIEKIQSELYSKIK